MIQAVPSAFAESARLTATRLPYKGNAECVCAVMRRPDATQRPMSRHTAVLKQDCPVVNRRDALWGQHRITSDLPLRRIRLAAALIREVMA